MSLSAWHFPGTVFCEFYYLCSPQMPSSISATPGDWQALIVFTSPNPSLDEGEQGSVGQQPGSLALEWERSGHAFYTHVPVSAAPLPCLTSPTLCGLSQNLLLK